VDDSAMHTKYFLTAQRRPLGVSVIKILVSARRPSRAEGGQHPSEKPLLTRSSISPTGRNCSKPGKRLFLAHIDFFQRIPGRDL